MHIAVLCATHRGYRFLDRLTELAPRDRFTVFSFRETPEEPPFLDDIRTLATSRGAAFHQGRKVGLDRYASIWESDPVDLLFAVSWRYMVPRHVYGRASRGAYVLHDSLLPDKRGFAPTVWSIVRGETTTGVTLLEMADDVDAGDIVDQVPLPIWPDETIREVMERVTRAYLDVLERNLGALRAGTASATPQDHGRATFTEKFRRENARIDWALPTNRIYDLIRGYTRPYPGAFTQLGDREVVVLEASRDNSGVRDQPGRVLEVRGDGDVVVATGDGSIVLRRVEVAGEDGLTPGRVLGVGATLGRPWSTDLAVR